MTDLPECARLAQHETLSARLAQHETLSERVALAPQLPQRQDSTIAQLSDLLVALRRLGLRDAADSLQARHGQALPTASASIQTAMSGLAQQRDVQMSLSVQLLGARTLANRLGAYDAADLLRTAS